MKRGRQYITAALVAALALCGAPAAEALPDGVSEYVARYATGTLYVPYTERGKSAEPTEETREELPPPTLEETTKEETTEEEKPLPQGAIPVGAVNLSRLEIDDTPALLLSNETKYSANLKTLADMQTPGEKGAVLIIHTHGTESYLPDDADYYTPGEDFRTRDKSQNVVAVGQAFAATLEAAGIKVYHDTEMYDALSFNNAYDASRSACRDWLKKHPEISYIIDIHRDAVTDKEGNSQKTLCTAGGKEMAQVMLVIGTNEAGANHPDWEKNLSLAAKYQKLLNVYPTFARPIYLRRASFNQQLCEGSLLLEVGSAANTLTEAKDAATLAAKQFILLYNR